MFSGPTSCAPRRRTPNTTDDVPTGSKRMAFLSLSQNSVGPRQYVHHVCGPACVEWTGYDAVAAVATLADSSVNALAVSFRYGFVRYTSQECRMVVYKTPCGQYVRNPTDMHRYLLVTGSRMTVDQFDFDVAMDPLRRYTAMPFDPRPLVSLSDMSGGRELKPISCVNAVNRQKPPPMNYVTNRLPAPGVRLVVDEFLCGCECTDDCSDASRCACRQMTAEEQPAEASGGDAWGYVFRRLFESRGAAAVYECNRSCRCSTNDRCLNRVVQRPIAHQLQLFMTDDRGWGVRCLHDIPHGSFVSCYHGEVLTGVDAEERGEQPGGDMYMAELDFVHRVEHAADFQKRSGHRDHGDGQQTYSNDDDSGSGNGNDDDDDDDDDVDDDVDDVDDDDDDSDEDDDDDYRPPATKMRKTIGTAEKRKNTKFARPAEDDANDGGDNDTPTAPPAFGMALRQRQRQRPDDHDRRNGTKLALDLYYEGDDELDAYVVDGKRYGNIARYFNHSCTPNMFVQSVFVDTHDPRLPWIAFFAAQHIVAGTELTWDYNYEPRSIPGKRLECLCGTRNCRKRLL